MKVINTHLAEQPECKHSLKDIMIEALENKSGLGNEPNPDVETTKSVTKRFGYV